MASQSRSLVFFFFYINETHTILCGLLKKDIATLDAHTPHPSPRYKSSPIQPQRSVRIHISLI
jgi:hypothetical protein